MSLLKFVRTLNATRLTIFPNLKQHPELVVLFHGTGCRFNVKRDLLLLMLVMHLRLVECLVMEFTLVIFLINCSICWRCWFWSWKGTVDIYKCKPTLGNEKKDYDSAGLNGNDRIISPEWVVYDPGNQVKYQESS